MSVTPEKARSERIPAPEQIWTDAGPVAVAYREGGCRRTVLPLFGKA